MYEKWSFFERRVHRLVQARFGDKIEKLNNKLNRLCRNDAHAPSVPTSFVAIDDFVVNQSSESFDYDQLLLLNHGLKYVPPSSNFSPQQIVTDVEASIAFQPRKLQDVVRVEVERVLQESATKHHVHHVGKFDRLINELHKKSVYYIKADKGTN